MNFFLVLQVVQPDVTVAAVYLCLVFSHLMLNILSKNKDFKPLVHLLCGGDLALAIAWVRGRVCAAMACAKCAGQIFLKMRRVGHFSYQLTNVIYFFLTGGTLCFVACS